MNRTINREQRELIAKQYAEYSQTVKGIAAIKRWGSVDPFEDGDDLVQQAALGIIESGTDPKQIKRAYWIRSARNRAVDTLRRRLHPTKGQVPLLEDYPTPLMI